MLYPYIEMSLKEDIDNDTKIILSKYWQFEGGLFQHSATQLKHEHQITQHELNYYVGHSTSFVIFGDCIECKESVRIPVKNKTEANQKVENCYYHFLCVKCRNNQKSLLKEINKKQGKKLLMNHSYKYKLWERLNEFELFVFKEILRLNTWNNLCNKLAISLYDETFKTVLKLNKIHLIDIYYDLFDKRIREIYFLPEMITALNITQSNLLENNSDSARIGETIHISEIFKK